MTRIILEPSDDVVSALNKIREINDKGIDLEIPEGSVLFENVLNIKLIRKQAEKYGLVVHFETTDENGTNLIAMLDEGGVVSSMADTFKDIDETPIETKKRNNVGLPKFKMPNIKLPKIFDKTDFALPGPALLAIGTAIVIVILFMWSKNTQIATAKIIVNAQPLARSITIKVKSGTSTSPTAKILNGITITANVDNTKTGPTTGEKLVGEKAAGKATIYNYTSTDQTFKKGTVLTYSSSSNSYNFVTKAEITVAAQTTPADPGATATPGQAEVEITADTIGSSYNVKKDATLRIKNFKKEDFLAKVTEATTGGKSETTRIVADIDIKNIAAELTKTITEQSSAAFAGKISNNQQIIAGSVQASLISQSTDHKIGDTADTVTVTQTMQVQGLTYLKGDLDRLLDTLVKDLIPQGFILSDKERQVNAESLGNSSTSIANPTEADIQVTLKTYIVPDIAEDSIKKSLMGKTEAQAQEALKSVQNIKSYDFELGKSIFPFLNKVPTDPNKVKVTIERQ